MIPKMLDLSVFWAGWILFVAAQAQNSVRSSANGLEGFAGFKRWIKLQAINLLTRVFCSAIFYGTLITWVSQKLRSVGFALEPAAISGLAGYSANAFLYQIFGLIPWLRVEIGDLAPPAKDPPK